MRPRNLVINKIQWNWLLSAISCESPCKLHRRQCSIHNIVLALSDQLRIRYPGFGFFNLVIFVCKRISHLLLVRSNEKLTELNMFRIRKTTISYTFLIKLRFQWYRCKRSMSSLHEGPLETTITVPLVVNYE